MFDLFILRKLPQPEKHPDIVDDDIEKKEIARDSGCKCYGDDIDDFVASALDVIDRANARGTTEIDYDGDRKKRDPREPEQPLVIAIECIGQAGGKSHRAQAREHNYDGAQAAQRCDDDRYRR